jgi:hypothetical protein
MLAKVPYVVAFLSFALVVTGCNDVSYQQSDSGLHTEEIDQRSFRLGTFTAFCEIVSLGIKQMALSAAATSDEMDELINEANHIAEQHDVEIYREEDFLVTDLFPESATQDKHVLVIYQNSTLERYFSLKEQKAELVKSGAYSGAARRDIAWRLGKLLSYPDEKIAALIEQNSSARTVE